MLTRKDKKKKIGILTFHYAHNYGAVLQAFALKEYLKMLGCEVSIINYQNTNIKKAYPVKLSPLFFVSKSEIGKLRFAKKVMFDIISGLRAQKSWKKQWNAFEGFVQENLNSEEIVTEEEFERFIESYDIIIIGSDQVWDRRLVGYEEKIYFGNFKKRKNQLLITYAASRFENFDDNENIDFIKNFDGISVREKSLEDFINNKFNRKISMTACDPTFLIKSDDYRKLLGNEKANNSIFVYYVYESKVLGEIVEKVKEVNMGKKVEALHYYFYPYLQEACEFADLGPKDFISKIYNSYMVLTNSFHGVAFSIIFKKQFYCIYDNKKNQRISDLLSELKIENHYINTFNEIDFEDKINYDNVSHRLERYVSKSKRFLDKYVNG